MRHIFCFWALLCLSLSVSAQEMMEPVVDDPIPVVLQVDPSGTYLRTAPGDPANSPSTFLLDTSLVQPGDQLIMIAAGAFSPGVTTPDETSSIIGVFADSGGNFYSSPSVIQQNFPGTPSIITLPSSLDGVPTDIIEDFPVSNIEPLSVIVPAGADRMLFSVNDAFFADNSDPNGDNRVNIVIRLLVDLIVQDIAIAQVIEEPDFVPYPAGTDIAKLLQDSGIPSDGRVDLVKDKSAIAIVNGLAPGYSGGFFLVEFKITGPDLVSEININGIAEVSSDRTFKAAINLPTNLVGNFQVVASIIPDQGLLEADLTNNISPARNFQVRQTSPLDIGIVQMTGCQAVVSDCPGSVSLSQTTKFVDQEQIDFLTRIYPVADSGQLSVSLINNNFLTTVDFSQGLPLDSNNDEYDQGILEDIRRLAVLNTANLKHKTFAVVPDNYFCFHNIQCRTGPNKDDLTTYGIVFPSQNLSVGFVRGDSPETLAHELAHLMGQDNEATDITEGISPNPDMVGRFFVNGIDASKYIEPTVVDLSGGNLESIKVVNKEPIMGGLISPDFNEFWISRNTYIKAFNTLLNPAIDPEIYVVSGFLDRDGNLTNTRVEEFPQGFLTPDDVNGVITVQTFGLDGNPLSSVSVNPEFKMIVSKKIGGSGPPRIVELDRVPVVFAVPKTDEVASIKVFEGEEELFEEVIIEPEVKVSELIKSIPLSAFKGKGWYRWYNRFKKRILIDIAKSAERLEAREKNKVAIWSYRKLKKLVNRWVKSKYKVDGDVIKRKTITSKINDRIRDLKESN